MATSLFAIVSRQETRSYASSLNHEIDSIDLEIIFGRSLSFYFFTGL